MDELAKMRRIIDKAAPGTRVETMLVIDATTGQNALLQAEAFSKIVDLSGLIITKLDGNAKGGVTLAVADLVKVPIYFAGLGEQADDLVDFDPAYFVDSLLPEEGGI
jgi:fused signal recognition particle receptor